MAGNITYYMESDYYHSHYPSDLRHITQQLANVLPHPQKLMANVSHYLVII